MIDRVFTYRSLPLPRVLLSLAVTFALGGAFAQPQTAADTADAQAAAAVAYDVVLIAPDGTIVGRGVLDDAGELDVELLAGYDGDVTLVGTSERAAFAPLALSVRQGQLVAGEGDVLERLAELGIPGMHVRSSQAGADQAPGKAAGRPDGAGPPAEHGGPPAKPGDHGNPGAGNGNDGNHGNDGNGGNGNAGEGNGADNGAGNSNGAGNNGGGNNGGGNSGAGNAGGNPGNGGNPPGRP